MGRAPRADRTLRSPPRPDAQIKIEFGRPRIEGDCANINPLAVLLPTRVYLALEDIRHPHEPRLATVEGMYLAMTPEERRLFIERAQRVRAYLGGIEKVARKYRALTPAAERRPRQLPARAGAAFPASVPK